MTMPSLRVSATDIDALRYFLSDEDAEVSDLLRRLRKEESPSEAMLAGSALHAALESAAEGSMEAIAVDGYQFTFQCEGEIDLPSTREMKATREYQVGGVEVTLVGKVDAIHGRRVDDHKFTSRYDAERFLNSYQWRVYLDVFGADEFRWNVFEGREIGEKQYLISNLHKLTMHRYPGLEDDVQRELATFVGFARDHLPERFHTAALPDLGFGRDKGGNALHPMLAG